VVSEETYLKNQNPYNFKKRKDWRGKILIGEAVLDDLRKRETSDIEKSEGDY
jgi:hypothetical protein